MAFCVSDAAAISTEVGFYYFNKKEEGVVVVPFLLDYRHTPDGSGYGIYIEPTAGYSIGATSLTKYNPNGSPVYNENGAVMERQARGIRSC